MNAKITVPKEVAAAIRFFTDLADSKSEAFTDILSMGFEGTNSEIILRHFDGNHDELMEALICGYEVEKTPEEKVRQFYTEVKQNRESFSSLASTHMLDKYYAMEYAIKETLNLLGIKIEGVNITGGGA
jgi:DNA integrity scanning protein DisA with diadenylate cyclase activity